MKTKDIAQIGLMVALLSISAYISIPIPIIAVMITAQTIIINLIALIFSPKQAIITIIIYIILGFIGLPVFSGGMGGPAKLFGPTGGYIFAYLIVTPLISYLRQNKQSYVRNLLLTIVLGIPVIYGCGSLWLAITTKADFMMLFINNIIGFAIGDILKCILASTIAMPLYRALRYIDY